MTLPNRLLYSWTKPLLYFIIFISIPLQGCRSPEAVEATEQGPIRISWPESDREGLADAEIAPFELKERTFLGSGRFNSVFWLDFEGATVSAQDSFIVNNAGRSQVFIPPFSPADILSNENREDLIGDIVQRLIPLFPDVDIQLTTTRPFSGVFSRVHIGGQNFTGSRGVLGIAPLDLGNRIANDILFVYTKEMRNIGRSPESIKTQLVHVIAHEIAHALGARHIDNNFAIMRPSVGLQADSFDLSGPVVDTPTEIEHSLQVLLNSAGSRSLALAEDGLPNIVDLAAFSTDDVIQYSVISQRNMDQNPGLKLNDFRYQWEIEGQRSEGTSVLMRFDDRDDHILELTVSDASGDSRQFQFLVGRRR
ncbi:MAG: matrixin family metalloprotease [Oligoflexus sp.]